MVGYRWTSQALSTSAIFVDKVFVGNVSDGFAVLSQRALFKLQQKENMPF